MNSTAVLRFFPPFIRTALASESVRQIGETYFTRLGILALSMITSVFVSRILGPEGRGMYAVAGALAAIGIQFGNLGLHSSNIYFVARDKGLLNSLLANSLVVSFCFGGVGALITYFVFLQRPDLAPVQGLLQIMALIWIPFGLANLLLQNLLIGVNEIHIYNVIELTTKIATLGLIGAAIYFHFVTPESLFALCLGVLVLAVIWALLQLKRHCHKVWRPSFKLFKENQKYGSKAYLTALFAFLVLKSDLLLLNRFEGSESAGYYSVATALADLINMLPTVVATVVFPKLSSIQDMEQKWKMTKKAVLSVGASLIILIAMAYLFARPAISIIYGKAFLPAIPAFLLLLPGAFFYGTQVVLAQFLASVGFPITIVLIWALALITNVILNLQLIPRFSVSGSAVSSSISYFLVFVLIYLTARGERNGSRFFRI